jgi:SAM-dependent methyltransferase
MTDVSDHAFRQVGDVSVDAGRGPGQLGWYRFVANLVAGQSVIDVGCGLGEGLQMLRTRASQVSGQDLDPRLAGPGIIIGPVSAIPDSSYDFVSCVDVVEHVTEDKEFVRQLSRVARRGVVMTTPLWIRGRQVWPFHVREYTFAQFIDLCSPLGRCQYWKGTPSGDRIYPIPSVDRFLMTHRLLNSALTNVPTRAFQKLLPESARNLAHQAVLIRLD